VSGLEVLESPKLGRCEWDGRHRHPWAAFHAAIDRTIRILDVFAVGQSSSHVVRLTFRRESMQPNDSAADNSIKYRLKPAGLCWTSAPALLQAKTVSGRSYSADTRAPGTAMNWRSLHTHRRTDPRAATGFLPSTVWWGCRWHAKFGPIQPICVLRRQTRLHLCKRQNGRGTRSRRGCGVGRRAAGTLKRPRTTTTEGTSLNASPDVTARSRRWSPTGYYLLSKRTELYATLFQNRFSDGYKLEAVNIAALNRNPAEATVSGHLCRHPPLVLSPGSDTPRTFTVPRAESSRC